MYFTGIIIAAMTFLTIGLWHPIVIKTEYYFGTRPWAIYLLVGISCCVAALFISNVYISSFLGVFGASALWGIGELFVQGFHCYASAAKPGSILRKECLKLKLAL